MEKYSDDILGQVSSQVRSLVERYNKLAENSEDQRRDTLSRNSQISNLKNEIYNEIEQLKRKITEIDSMITNAQGRMNSTSSEFKSIVKKDSMDKLQRKVDALKYEQFMTKKELDRSIKKD